MIINGCWLKLQCFEPQITNKETTEVSRVPVMTPLGLPDPSPGKENMEKKKNHETDPDLNAIHKSQGQKA